MKAIDRVIAAYLIVQSIAGTVTAVAIQRASGTDARGTAPLYLLSGFALIAGIGSLLNKSWARWLGVAVFAFQILEIVTPEWMYRLFLAFRLALAFGWSQQIEIGVNFLALVAFLLAFSRIIALKRAHT